LKRVIAVPLRRDDCVVPARDWHGLIRKLNRLHVAQVRSTVVSCEVYPVIATEKIESLDSSETVRHGDAIRRAHTRHNDGVATGTTVDYINPTSPCNRIISGRALKRVIAVPLRRDDCAVPDRDWHGLIRKLNRLHVAQIRSTVVSCGVYPVIATEKTESLDSSETISNRHAIIGPIRREHGNVKSFSPVDNVYPPAAINSVVPLVANKGFVP
jgi:hypothetical protein